MNPRLAMKGRSVLFREIGRRRFLLYWFLAFAWSVLWLVAARRYDYSRTYITELDYERSLRKSYRRRLDAPVHPWTLTVTDEQRQRIAARLMQLAEDGRGF